MLAETYEPPREITFRNVMFWEPESKELLRLKNSGVKEVSTILTKAEDFLRNDCIVEIGFGEFICKPIKGYNKTTYKIKNGECNCQGFARGLGFCSHTIAVKQFKFIKCGH
jgi:hypothetical protein